MKVVSYILSALLVLVSCATGEDSATLLRSEEDLAGCKVATVNGSYYARLLSAREDVQTMLFSQEADAVQALLIGKADVLVSDETLLNRDFRSGHGIEVAFKGKESIPTALMFRKDGVPLTEAMNELQRQMTFDGTLDSLKTYWLKENYLNDKTYSHIPEEKEGEPLRVVSITTMAPIAFMVEGEWYGLEMDLVRALARKLHRQLVIKNVDAGSGMMALKTGMADIMIGCIFITDERKEEFLFCEPYNEYHPAYYVMGQGVRRGGASIWKRIGNSLEKNLVKENRWKLITSGLWETVKITVFAILLGAILGIGLCAMARSRRRWMRSAASAYNWFMAGIPMLVLLLILFYVVFAGSGLNSTAVAVVAFALNFASGASSAYGTSLDAVSHGQTEAGLALGFTRLQTFFHIVLPQAAKTGMPLFRSQCIALLKGTSIVGYIAIQDLTRAGDIIRGRTFDALVPLLVVTVIYFVLAWLLGLAVKLLATPKKSVL
ncbi:MAG: ABC transporter substrate-binding protein/permease [Bacteroidales bacterium]|nr:ABC transporter substrate-binding protein/permease [Bacteroidales bacterium]